MAASIVFVPIGNGDMTLITLDNGQTILIDIKIRAAADDEDDETYDVASDLKDRLRTDADGRPYCQSTSAAVDNWLDRNPLVNARWNAGRASPRAM